MNPGVGWHLRRRVRGPHSLKLEGARFVGRSLRDAAARRGRRGTARGMGRGRRLMAPGDRPRIGAPGRRSRRLGRGRVVLLPDPSPPRLRDRAWLSRGGQAPRSTSRRRTLMDLHPTRHPRPHQSLGRRYSRKTHHARRDRPTHRKPTPSQPGPRCRKRSIAPPTRRRAPPATRRAAPARSLDPQRSAPPVRCRAEVGVRGIVLAGAMAAYARVVT